jgi:hypothetical protein
MGVSIAIFYRQTEAVTLHSISSNNSNRPSREQGIERPLKTDLGTKDELPVFRAQKSGFIDTGGNILAQIQVPDSSILITTKQQEIQPVKIVSIQEAPDPIPVKELPKSRFKLSITEEPITGIDQTEAALKEKRYTMADVMNRKDGISLSKFLDNAKTHIVEDKEKHITYIEYIAADMSVLVVPLTN